MKTQKYKLSIGVKRVVEIIPVEGTKYAIENFGENANGKGFIVIHEIDTDNRIQVPLKAVPSALENKKLMLSDMLGDHGKLPAEYPSIKSRVSLEIKEFLEKNTF